ncbi:MULTISPECIES: T9SS type A sorting domain-containing protein [unclassified Flavobacterium]|uniref:DUF7619 domain-containing protein n=1 Tax=unclassified Flavobacterium TaxID=196869 RepID=UPI001F137935|nr:MULTISPECIES: T9SS type A sorting domain-containing protein [unclassified Flavobacterium]UMY64749.1 T9SS type A sorting domain-containing protein [Flavobacterium sp. HJ-32-4]
MKKIYPLLLLAFGVTQAQIVNIPDANFKAKLLAPPMNGYGAVRDINGVAIALDANNNGEVEVSEANGANSLDVSFSSIASLEGVQYFTNLEELDCGYNPLTVLGPLPQSLRFLNCQNNYLGGIDLSGLSLLELLNCHHNNLTVLGPLPPGLRRLDCSYNSLSTLNLSGLSLLESVACSANQLQSFTLPDTAPALHVIKCESNQLVSLDATGLTGLEILLCQSNYLTLLGLPVQNTLKELYCQHNNLVSLDLSSQHDLLELECDHNQLTNLVFSPQVLLSSVHCEYNNLTQLAVPHAYSVYCQYNDLTSLSVGPTQLYTLICNNNVLIDIHSWPTYPLLQDLYIAHNDLLDIDFSKFPVLQNLICGYNSFTSLNFDNASPSLSSLSCKGNTQLQYLSFKGTYPLLNWNDPSSFAINGNSSLAYICANPQYVPAIQQVANAFPQPAEVNSYCVFTPGATNIIEGKFTFGCLSDSPGIPFQKLSVSDSEDTTVLYSNKSGNYLLDHLGSGTFIVNPVAPSPYLVFQEPSSASVTFPDAASPFVQNFCATAIGPIKDAEVLVVPMGIALPGFNTTYKVIVRNRGTVALSGQLKLLFDDNLMNLSQSLPVAGTANPGVLTWNANNILPFSEKAYTATFLMNTPTASPPLNLGDILSFTATVTVANEQTPANNTTTISQTVVNPFDPNDKTCLEGETIGPEMAGQYLHYLIRFENTGTYWAQNVIVEDLIDTAKFDISTLEPLNGSHAFTTRITGNKVEFIFNNIMLPFDDANNDGWVLFRIKTKPTLVLGDSVSNTAGIYFNFNPPVITNTATTTFATMGVDSQFDSSFRLWPNPANDVVNMESKRGEAITSVSVYNTLGQELLRQNGNDVRSMNVSGLAAGTYIITVTTDKSKSATQLIKK